MSPSASNLYYAFGGGLGHLTRANAVRHSLGLGEDFVVLSATPPPQAQTKKITQHLAPPNLESDIPALRNWISDAIQRFQPKAFFVDAFPGGLLGELCDFPWPAGLELIHIARILRWDVYAQLMQGALPRYTQTWLVEDVEPMQRAALNRISRSVAPLLLNDSPSDLDDIEIIVGRWAAQGQAIWLVVHSGPNEETAELLAYARECAAQENIAPHFAIVSPGTPLPDEPGIERIDLYPANALFPFAARIVTACGFNVMRQAAPWRDTHLCLPFARRFDDQFLRRRRAYANT